MVIESMYLYIWESIHINGVFKHAAVLATSEQEARYVLKQNDREFWWHVSGKPMRTSIGPILSSTKVIDPKIIKDPEAIIFRGGD